MLHNCGLVSETQVQPAACSFQGFTTYLAVTGSPSYQSAVANKLFGTFFAGLASYKLLPELLSASKTGQSSLPNVTYQSTTNLPAVDVLKLFSQVMLSMHCTYACTCT
jgi:hypothetical protein